MSNTIVTKEAERREAFREHMRGQLCPFRLKIETSATGTVRQYMMPCDPDCAALIHKADLTSYSCLRLTITHFECKNTVEVFSGLPEEVEDNASE